MKSTDFTQSKAGQLITTVQGYLAFLPDNLPPVLDVTWDLASQLSEADRAVSELAGVARTLPNPHLLINPFIRREAVLSSRIEGTQASLSDLFFFEASGLTNPRTPDVGEVANYVKALEHGLARLKELPISLRMIREIHAHLMEGVRGEDKEPGEFRRVQNWIGPTGCSLKDATFVPPPPAEMHAALDALEKYMHASSPLPPLVRLALIHYQFEAIHPFLDGNGRIGRLLITLSLCASGLLPQPLLYLSAYFERHRDAYYDGLLAVSQSGRWLNWISFFLRGVAEQARDAIRRSDRLLELRETYRMKLQTARASALPLQLIDDLFGYPATTIPRIARRLKITQPAASRIVQKLIDKQVLEEITGQQRNRVFIASEILRAIEAQEID